MSRYQKIEPAYRKIIFNSTRMEDRALNILQNLGIMYRYVGLHQYEITSGQCALLRKEGIDYKFKR